MAGDEIILVAPVGVSRRIGVVLEEIDVARDSLLVQAAFGVDEQAFENALAGLVVSDQFGHVVALGSCIFRVRSTSKYRRAPFRRKTLLLRPHDTTRRKRYRATSSGDSRRCPLNVHVTPYSFSSPKMRRSMTEHYA